MEDIRRLLAANDLELDDQVEVFVVCRRQGRLVACAGLDHYTIKCVAVAEDVRGESLSLELGSEVVQLAAARGQFHLFLYSEAAQPAVVPRLGVLSAGRSSAARRPDGEQPGRDRKILRQPARAAPAGKEDRRHRPQRQSVHARPSLPGRAGRPRVRLAPRVRGEGGRLAVFLCRSLRARRRGREGHRQPHAVPRLRLHHLARHVSPLLPEGEGDRRPQLGRDRPAPVSRIHRAGARHHASLCRHRAVRSRDQQLQRGDEGMAGARGLHGAADHRGRNAEGDDRRHSHFRDRGQKAPRAARFLEDRRARPRDDIAVPRKQISRSNRAPLNERTNRNESHQASDRRHARIQRPAGQGRAERQRHSRHRDPAAR